MTRDARFAFNTTKSQFAILIMNFCSKVRFTVKMLTCCCFEDVNVSGWWQSWGTGALRDFTSKAWGVEEQPCPLTQCHVEVFHCVSWLRKPFLHEPPPTGRSSFHPWSLPCLTAVLRKETSKFKTCALPFNILESSDQCSCVCRLCWLQKHWLNSGLYLRAKMGFSRLCYFPLLFIMLLFFLFSTIQQ